MIAGVEAEPTPESFFAGDPEGLAVYVAVKAAVDSIGPADVRTTKSQVAFRRRRGFAFVWRPDQYLRRPVPPAVLSIALRRELRSRRFKQTVQPSPSVFMHHLEISAPGEVDEEVVGWLREAYDAAG